MDYRGLASKLRAMVRNAATREDLTMVLNGTSFRITCAGFQPSEISFLSIRNLLTADHDDPPAETFYIINRDSSELAAFLPETLRIPEGRFIHSSEEGRAALSLEYGFFSLYLSDEHETFIWLCSDKQSPDNFISHPFHMELSWWALREGYMFLHSAAVGMENKGILLSGAGGSGKSTLALSALISGMQYLSDDYVLIDPSPSPAAVRIYDTGYIKDDMLRLLPELQDNAVWRCDERKKTLIGLGSRYDISDRLPLHAVVIPHISHSDKPIIERNTDIRKLIPLLASTSYQNRELKNKDVFFGMMRLLNDLPAYDYYLTDDIRRNADYLKEWVRRL